MPLRRTAPQQVPAGTRLLPFCIVAKIDVAMCDGATLEAVYAELRRRGIGSGKYERWERCTAGGRTGTSTDTPD